MKKVSSPVFLVALLFVSVLASVYILGRSTDSSPQSVSTVPSSPTQLAQVSGAGSNLLAWWNLDEGSGSSASDSSGNGRTASVSGASWTAGTVGSGALSFNGSGNFMSATGGARPAVYSFALWVKIPVNPIANGAFIAWGTDAFCQDTGGNSFICTTDGNGSGGASLGALADGNWHHVAYVVNGSSQQAYVDGVQTGSSAKTPTTESSSIQVGNRLGSSAYFNGSVDDVRVYAKALSSADIAQLVAMKGTSGGGGATTYSLTLSNSNTSGGSVTSNPAGISCGATCTVSNLAANSAVTLTASPNANFTTSWSGCSSSNGNSCTVNISTANASVSVNFTPTGQPIAPSISGVSASSVTQTTATINWSTDQAATSQVRYGTTASYGSQTTADNTNLTSHSQSLSGLTANTVYHYTVVSGNTNGNAASPGDFTFTTLTQQSGAINAPTNLVVPLNLTDDILLAINGSGQTILNFKMTWTDNSTNENNFQLFTSNDGVNFTAPSSYFPAGSTGYDPIAMPLNVRQYFKLRACNATDCSGFSNTVSMLGMRNPTNLLATVIGTTQKQIKLTFTDRAALGQSGSGIIQVGPDAADGRIIERSTDGGASFTTIATLRAPYTSELDVSGHQVMTYVDSGPFSPGTTYTYRVRGFYDAIPTYSEPSNTTSINPGAGPNPPVGVSFQTAYLASAGTPYGVALTFNDNSNNEDGFKVYRSTDSVNWGSPIVSYPPNSGGSVGIIDANIVGGTTYYYKVVSYNVNGESSFTAYKIIAPRAPLSTTHTWYIDNQVPTSSRYDGSSWSNAWANISSIDWQLVQPGDVMYISGGASSDTYAEQFNMYVGGTAGNPVTVRVGQDAGHNGRVILSLGINLRNTSYVTLDGSKTNGTSVSDAHNVESNIGLEVTDALSTCIYTTAGTGDRILSTEVHNCGSQNLDGTVNHGEGITFNSTGYVPGIEVAYDHVHDTWGYGMLLTWDTIRQYGDAKVHNNLVEYTHDNHLQSSGGLDIYNNVFRNFRSPGVGHPDGLQIWPDFIRVYNNEMHINLPVAAPIYVELGAPTIGHLQIYNNVVFENPGETSNGIMVFTTEYANAIQAAYDPSNPGPWLAQYGTMNLHDVLIANNLFYYQDSNNFLSITDRPPGQGPTSINMTNWKVVNNIFSPPNSNCSGGSASINLGSFNYTTSDVIFNNNDMVNCATLSYRGTSYATPAAVSAATPFKSNFATTPQFANAAGDDFHFSGGLAAFSGTGMSLSSYTDGGIPPGLNADMSGAARSSSAGWDVGPYNTGSVGSPVDTTTGLKLRIDFNDISGGTDNFVTGRFADKSGNGNNADCVPNFSLNGVANNQCPTQTTGPDGTAAAQFRGNGCTVASDYLNITKSASLDNLSQGTIALWASYDFPADGSTYWNSKLMDTYYLNAPHSWMLGRDGDPYTLFKVNSDLGENNILYFPDGTITPGMWSHYAVAWDASNIYGYFNGKLFNTISRASFSNLSEGTYVALSALMHGEPRNSLDPNCVLYYGGDPTKQYIQPNAGFLNGKLDDVRVYNRPLQSTEVAALASTAITPPTSLILQVTKSGSGYGTVNGSAAGITSSGIGCGKICAQSFPPGSTVTLTATPLADSVFTGWVGAGCSGTGSCVINLTSGQTVTATFTRAYQSAAFFEAEAGTLASPFLATAGAIYQGSDSAVPSQGGRAAYTFTVPSAGNYLVSAIVNAPTQANNSFWVNIDSEPTDGTLGTTDMTWHIQTTSGFEDRLVSWGGSTDGIGNLPHVFALSAGTHTLIIRGRENGTFIDNITVLNQGSVATPTDTTAPIVSLTSPTGGTITGVVTLSANATDPTVSGQTTSGIFSVQFLLDGSSNIATLSTPPFSGNWNTTGVSNGPHTVTAVARDVAGNQTTSAPISITVNNPVITADVTAPSIPTALTATVISSSQINLTWNASTDPTIVNAITSGVGGYRLYRGGTLIATLPGTSYSNTGLTASTLYSYTVSSYDNANNSSNQSSAVTATTQAPPVNPPANLSNGSPLTALPAGTTQTILSLSTNIAATCKYSTVANTSYASMTGTFTTTGNTTHSATINGLANGTTYTYYVRCTTSLGIVNTGDYIISFSVASPAAGGGGPTGYVPPSSGGGGGGPSAGAAPGTPSPVGIFTPTVAQKPLPAPTGSKCVPTTSALPAGSLSLTIGSRGSAVSNLQQFLVTNGYLTSDLVTGFFGPLTNAALNKYQVAHPTTSCAVQSTGKFRLPASFQFPTTLITYTTSTNVKNLQILLNDRGYTVSVSGPGSIGNETMYYGPATIKALGKFQAANSISPSVGNFGPITKGAVNMMLATGK